MVRYTCGHRVAVFFTYFDRQQQNHCYLEHPFLKTLPQILNEEVLEEKHPARLDPGSRIIEGYVPAPFLQHCVSNFHSSKPSSDGHCSRDGEDEDEE